MKGKAYPNARLLWLAAAFSLLGQLTAVAFMLHSTPYTTFLFVSIGIVCVFLGMALFGYVSYLDI